MTRIYVAGHTGLVGSAIVRRLRSTSDADVETRTHAELDLRDRAAVSATLNAVKPDTVILAAARVGGINANMHAPVSFLVDNLDIQTSVMLAAVESGASTLMFLGSSCIYPRLSAQPMREEYLMTGPLEPTNESYALAKLTGLRLAQALHHEHGVRVITPLPCNVYGPDDHFDLDRAHVLGALVKRFTDATASDVDEVTLWGTGTARREFIHADDLAAAVAHLLDCWDSPEPVNVGTGTDVSIKELAGMIATQTGFAGAIAWDTARPDGMPQKLLDIGKIRATGWAPAITLDEGIAETIAAYRRRR